MVTLTNWTTGLLFAQVSPIALENLGFQYFYVFFAFNMVSATCLILFYPETKGWTLEQLDQVFGDQIKPHALENPKATNEVLEHPLANLDPIAARD